MQVRSDISVLVIYQIQRFWKKFNYIDQSLNRLLMQLRYDPLKLFISHLISIQIILNFKKNEFFNRSTHVWSIENNFKVIWTRLKLMNILILLFFNLNKFKFLSNRFDQSVNGRTISRVTHIWCFEFDIKSFDFIDYIFFLL